jgi:hypothetical protein
MSDQPIKKQDVVYWPYRHHLNSKSSVIRWKRGTVLGFVKHTKRYKGHSPLVLVQFDSNELASRVYLDELLTNSEYLALPRRG